MSRIDDIVMNIIHHLFFFNKKKRDDGSKYNNYIYLKEAAFIIKIKEHLTNEGMNRIKELKAMINKEYFKVLIKKDKVNLYLVIVPPIAKFSNCGKVLKTNLPN